MFDQHTDSLKNWLIALPFIFILCLIIVVLAFANLDGLSTIQRLEYGTQALTSVGIIFVSIALFINALYAAKRIAAIDRSVTAILKHTQTVTEQQITTSFTQVIKQLGNEKIAVRLGAIHTLEQIAQASPQEQRKILEILTAFVRENASLPPEELGKKKKFTKISTDIQAALTVIARCHSGNEGENYQLSLNHIDIRDADLHQANLRGVSLIGANLQGAIFLGANLQRTLLISANLQGAILTETNLQGAVFMGTNLEMANLQGADMRGAKYLTSEQIQLAIGDRNTMLPENLPRPHHWQ